MFNPCVEHCYMRYGKQYSPECDNECAYAKAERRIQQLEAQNAKLSEKIGQLQVELDAAIRDLGIACECVTCAHTEEWLKSNSERCQICAYHGGWYYDWRGVQKEE